MPVYFTVHQMCVFRNQVYLTWNRLFDNNWSLEQIFHENFNSPPCGPLTLGALMYIPGLTHATSPPPSDGGRTSSSELVSPPTCCTYSYQKHIHNHILRLLWACCVALYITKIYSTMSCSLIWIYTRPRVYVHVRIKATSALQL